MIICVTELAVVESAVDLAFSELCKLQISHLCSSLILLVAFTAFLWISNGIQVNQACLQAG